jgi:ElaB/YqjD/DUF883 family membrane-anchored ribosome-binding protein
MDDSRTEGAARNAAQTMKDTAGGLAGEARTHIAGAVRETADRARESLDDAKEGAHTMAETASDELAKLREKVESLLRDKVTPAIANAAEAAEGYARDAKTAVTGQAERAAETVKAHPLVAVSIIAALGFVIGRLSAPSYGPYRRR